MAHFAGKHQAERVEDIVGALLKRYAALLFAADVHPNGAVEMRPGPTPPDPGAGTGYARRLRSAR